MEQKSKESLISIALNNLEDSRYDISHASEIYGECIYDAFKKMLTSLLLTSNGFTAEKVYVLFSRKSLRTACYIEGINLSTGKRIDNIAVLRRNSSIAFEAQKISDSLEYLLFSEIEFAWEIMYKKVLPEGLIFEISYDFNSPYGTYKIPHVEDETVSALIMYFDSKI